MQTLERKRTTDQNLPAELHALCPDCEGRGEINYSYNHWEDDMGTCPRCKGSGETPINDLDREDEEVSA